VSALADVLTGRARYALVEGDCLEVLPMLPERSVAHVITDPPYEAEAHTKQRRVKANDDGRGTQVGGRDTRGARSAPIPFLPIRAEERQSAGLEMARVATRWSLVFCQVEATQRWADALAHGGATYRRTAVWVKPDGQPQLSGDRPGMGYESIVIAHAPGRSRWAGGGRVGVFVHNTARFDGVEGHPTPKPLSLMLELVELFTDPDEIVLDPFAGSATTGVACLRLGRRFIGVEKDPGYAAIARDRLTAESQGLSLRAYRQGQLPMFGEASP
jgi:site-specific DNA-methyltransferase (adenine-specific)